MNVTQVKARPVMVPLKRPPRAASGEIPQAPLVLIDLETDEGVVGRAYVFTFTRAMLGPTVGCVQALSEMILGDAVAPFELEAKLRQRLTLLDSPGLVGIALAGIDMAAWDAYAKSLGQPLVRVLGGDIKQVRAYNSCGLWIQDPATLPNEAEALLAEGGFQAAKLRVGRADFAGDLEAVRQVKARLGNNICLMSDFNQSLSLDEAIFRCRALDDEGLYWIEEPIRHDHYSGCAQIASEVKTPIQIGENLLHPREMQKAIEARAADFYMPDVQRIGGVTGWLRASALAHVHDLAMSSHLFPEISCHLLAITPTCHWLEYMDWANEILANPIRIESGHAVIPDRPGCGIEWDEGAVRACLVE
ncbi:mandelate racemase [Candidatus Entotheonella serta]|nr:mandelate racemase [Candidatus Entotheonella serta]